MKGRFNLEPETGNLGLKTIGSGYASAPSVTTERTNKTGQRIPF
jgi:hypothetical protein